MANERRFLTGDGTGTWCYFLGLIFAGGAILAGAWVGHELHTHGTSLQWSWGWGIGTALAGMWLGTILLAVGRGLDLLLSILRVAQEATTSD